MFWRTASSEVVWKRSQLGFQSQKRVLDYFPERE